MFARILALAFVLASAAPSPAGPPRLPTFPEFRISPTDLAAVLGEFSELCLRSPLDVEAFRAAARRSSWGFVQVRNSTERGRESWVSEHGLALFRRAPPAPRGMGVPQCNLESATRQPEAPATVVRELETILAATLGRVPPARTTEAGTVWRWPMRRGYFARLYLFQGSGLNPRILNLSLQLWRRDMDAEIADQLLDPVKP